LAALFFFGLFLACFPSAAVFFAVRSVERPMLVAAPEVAVGSPAIPLRPFARLRSLLLPAGAVLVLVLGALWLMRPAYAVDLGHGRNLAEADLLQHWKKGEVVALVRHAERCDQSSHPCLADASGITIEGSDTAQQVGDAFKALGMTRTDVYASPLTRTVQTSAFMFGKSVVTQPWLTSCKTTLQHDMLAHKAAHRNLLLVTHSTCINELEEQLNLRGAHYDSAYASTLFVTVDSVTGAPRVVGYMNADGWAKVLKEATL
jgi:phosphohistidine phosphatase SixA